MSSIARLSPAKINLTLRVGPRRSDGFHEVESLVARIDLCDTVSVAAREDARLTLACDDPSVPSNEDNLALRAARGLAQAARVRRPAAHIALRKRIPAGAGLGGGSSNAATTLMLLNQLWKTRLPAAELMKIGARIGADVPLFFHSPLCVVRGRGEQVEDLQRTLIGYVALVLPPIHCPTRDVYAAWDRLDDRPARPSASDVLQRADSARTLMPHLFNDLEPAALNVRPELAPVATALQGFSEGAARLTGSGAAFFHLFDERADAESFAGRVRTELMLRAEVASIATE